MSPRQQRTNNHEIERFTEATQPISEVIQPMKADLHPLWYCPKCRASGGLILTAGIDPYSAVMGITAAHAVKSPDCHYDVRVPDPDDWYASVIAKIPGGAS